MNLYQLFTDQVSRQPDAPAILASRPEGCRTYRELHAQIESASEKLFLAGLKPGHSVGLHCASGAEYIVLNYAAWRCGACVVPIPVELAEPEKQELCRTIALDLVITGRKGANFVESYRQGESVQLTPAFTAVPVTPSRSHPAQFDPFSSAFIRFTSGTTGSAKGVVLSHQSIYERINAANDILKISNQDRVLWLLSMSYHFAVSIVGYLSFGAGIILPDNHFAPAVCDAACHHRATLMYASPAHYTWIVEAADAKLPPTLRLAISTTAGVRLAAARKFHHRFGLPLTQALGIIEVGLPFINTEFAGDRPEAVGRVLPAYELRLEPSEFDPTLKEIWLRGPGFLDAYYEPWQTREQIMPDGWFRPGDVGKLDEDGCMSLRGRTKDVINVLGAKFFPQEVEAVLVSHPQVSEACVFARRDDRLGEAPFAYVVPVDVDNSPSEDELLALCRSRLAAFKIPQRIDLVPRLPRTASGKILHRVDSFIAESSPPNVRQANVTTSIAR